MKLQKEDFKMKNLLFLMILTLAFVSVYGQSDESRNTKSIFDKTKNSKIIRRDKSKPVRKEFEAIFAKQIADYKAQFESVRRGERLKPECAPDFVLKRPNGATLTCEQITAERQAKFQRIKAINYLKIEIGNIELDGNGAVVFTTQSFSRIVPGTDGRDYTITTDGTVHKEFWTKTDKGWQSRGFEEVKQGAVTAVD